MSLASELVDHFTKESALTRPLLEAVPQDMLKWHPHLKSMTLGQLAGHLVETPGWARNILEADVDLAIPSGYEPYVVTDTGAMLETYDRNVAAFRAALADRDDAMMLETWTMSAGDKVLMREPRHQALRTITVHHMIHHRGQLSVYLRLVHVPVPATYGPTADAAPF